MIGACLLGLLSPVVACAADSGPAFRFAEDPELAGLGALSIGTQTRPFAVGERTIDVRLWYPASVSQGATPAVYRHTLAAIGARPIPLSEKGAAVEGAPPLAGRRFPLVIVSHGFGGWGTMMSRLGETLASRGYIVAAIDHRDRPVRDLATFQASFASVLRHRAEDQRRVLRALAGGSPESSPVGALVDPERIGLIGYSMGGYGALITAGAVADAASPALAQLGQGDATVVATPDPEVAAKIKAVVALAPWGAQPASNVWSERSLAGLSKPMLLIDGDRDDVVDFERGVKRIFAQAKASDRYLLVFREAAHNIAGNPVTLPADADFGAIESVTDPVWRKERLDMITQHFIVAFLDRNLKGEAAKARYLAVPTPASDDGEWPGEFGRVWGGVVAGDSQPHYWRGFQRRWARGLELHHLEPGE